MCWVISYRLTLCIVGNGTHKKRIVPIHTEDFMETRHRGIFDIPSVLLLFAHCTHHTTNSTLAKSLRSASAVGSEIQNMTTDVPSTARCSLNVLTCRGIFMLELQQIGVHSFPEVLQREGQRWDLGRRENGNVNYSVCVFCLCAWLLTSSPM